MAEHTPTLVMGNIEYIGSDGEICIPSDEAVIHPEDDEDLEISVDGPDALRLALTIVAAVNAHDALVKALEDIISGDEKFRKAMGPHWEGDPLSDAIDAARAALAALAQAKS